MEQTAFSTSGFDEGTLAFLSRFEVGPLLGLGAFSEVRQITDVETGQIFAMKIIDKEQSRLENVAVENEIAILKQLRHPNIITLYNVYEGNAKIFLVMEYVTGGELFDRIVEQGHFTETDAAHVVRRIVEAVHYLHERGIAHRDLKPENLLLSDKSERARVMISDFGLSKIVNQEEMMRTACGTPGYVAPEVLNFVGYGKEVDLWSIGVIAYVLLCGYAPFYGEKDADLFHAIMNGIYEFDSPYWDPISAQAKDFISKLLTVDTKQRMTTKQALHHPWLRNIDRQESVHNLADTIKSSLIRNPSTRRPVDVNKVIDTAMDIRRTGTIRRTNSGDSDTPTSPPPSSADGDEAGASGDSGTIKRKDKKKRGKASDAGAGASPSSQEGGSSSGVDSPVSTSSTASRSSSIERGLADAAAAPAPAVEYGKTIRVLSYNFFLRPPLIKNNASDYKDARVALFIQDHLRSFDIIGFQEVFEYGSSRQEKLIEAAMREGFLFHARSPRKSLLQGKIDAGLLLLSRYPIVKHEFAKFDRGIYGDRLTAKGCLWAKVEISPMRFLHVFLTHLQRTYRNDEGVVDSYCALIRKQQIAFLKDFILRRANAVQAEEPVLILGDLEVDARAGLPDAVDSEEYLDMMDVLNGRDGSERLNIEDPLRVLLGENPVTFGDVREENGVLVPTDTVLTHKADQGVRQRLDYILWMDASPEAKIPPATLDRKSVKIEKFWKQGEKFTQLSDHYGVSANLFVPNLRRVPVSADQPSTPVQPSP